MNMESTLLISVLASAIGMGYIVYGRKQMKASALIAGIALCIYPYFIHNLWLSLLAGAAIMAAPFFIPD
jgi:FtsH-binding integral membrane protein